jgi:hypothetical protein
MAGKTVDFDETTEVGGFNPERLKEKKAPQVGPAPTDDPRRNAADDLKKKFENQSPKLRDS